ncbi:MAG TPA: FAD-binding oxidoreductase [Deltaproteobacteria bacterium]|nr:FAD-binding oxidoreductase [Deltaproteobacteria bacterium]
MAKKEALKERLSAIVGNDRYADCARDLSPYATCLWPVADGKPVCVVRPSNRNQIQHIMLAANDLDMNVVPVSSTGPRVRGDSVPTGEGIVVDLSSMDKIIRVDGKNNVAMIEPGVHFAELKAAVERQDMKLFMPLLPRPTKSVLASYMEREPVTIPKYHWDMMDPVLSTEIVFGNGNAMRTGSACGPGSLEEQWKHGLAQKNNEGPAQTSYGRVVQGAQGTYGIVTWISLRLGMKPRLNNYYFAPDTSLERLIEFAYKVSRLKYADEFFILNAQALATMLGKDASEIKTLRARQAPWTAVYNVCGYRHFPEKRMLYQEKGIMEFAQLTGVKIDRAVIGASAAKIQDIVENPCEGTYWKERAQGGYREVFFLTTLDKAPGFVAKAREVAVKFKYPAEEIGIYLQPVLQGRICHCEFTFTHDTGSDKAVMNADRMFTEMSKVMLDAGAYYSRRHPA